jgi:hypothetical protein
MTGSEKQAAKSRADFRRGLKFSSFQTVVRGVPHKSCLGVLGHPSEFWIIASLPQAASGTINRSVAAA